MTVRPGDQQEHDERERQRQDEEADVAERTQQLVAGIDRCRHRDASSSGELVGVDGELQERFFQSGAADLDVARAGIRREQSAHRGVGVGALQLDGVAVTGGQGDARKSRQGVGVDLGERRPDDVPAHARLDLRRRTFGDDPSPRHEHHPVGVGVGLLEVVRGEDDGLATGHERSHHGPEALARFDVEADGRLVEHHQLGIGDERNCEASTLCLPARESLRAACRHVLQTGEREHLVDPERVRIQRRDHRDQLAHREVADQRAGSAT